MAVTIGYPKLRCPISATLSMDKTAPSPGVSAGDLAVEDDIVGMYFTDADTGDTVAFMYRIPRVVVPCDDAATGDLQAGDKVYFDASEAEVTTSSGGNKLCGIVLESASLGDTEVLIDFDGRMSIVS